MLGLLKRFEDFEVYKRAYKISLEIHSVTLKFPKYEQYGMADQMRRASKSICSNFAEGFAKQGLSKLEFRKYLFIGIGSANEMIVWSDYSKDLDYINIEDCDRWKKEYDEIARMLQGVYRSLEIKD